MAAILLSRVNRGLQGWHWKIDLNDDDDDIIVGDLRVIDCLYRQTYGRPAQFMVTCNEADGLTVEFFINPGSGEPTEQEFLRALMASDDKADGPCLDFEVRDNLAQSLE